MEYQFYLPKLPYGVSDLEPYINAETIEVHHFVLHKRYVDNLNKALEGYPQYSDWTLAELIQDNEELPEEIRTPVFRNAGGVLNHNYYFDMMRPRAKGEGERQPTGRLAEAINRDFGSFADFKKAFKAQAMAVFGSGWTWLTADGTGKLAIINTANQVTPYSYGRMPIIPIDIWEHAYFLQYEAARDAYIDAWFEVADWEKAGIVYDANCLMYGI